MPTAIIQPELTSMPIDIPNILKVNTQLGSIGLFLFSDNSMCFGYLDSGIPYLYSPRLSVYDLETYCRDHYLKFVDVSKFILPKLCNEVFVHLVPFWESYKNLSWIYSDVFRNAQFIELQQTYDAINALNDFEIKTTICLRNGYIEIHLNTWSEESPQELIPLPFHIKISKDEYLVEAIWNQETPATKYISPLRKSVFLFYGFTAAKLNTSIFKAQDISYLIQYIDYFINGFRKDNNQYITQLEYTNACNV